MESLSDGETSAKWMSLNGMRFNLDTVNVKYSIIALSMGMHNRKVLPFSLGSPEKGLLGAARQHTDSCKGQGPAM